MHYTATSPPNVSRAVAIYIRWRRFVGATTALLAGVSVAIALVVAFMVVDRYAQSPHAVRVAGLFIALASLVAGVTTALFALFRIHNAFAITVRLDRAFPLHQDRWSSALDLSEQLAAGRNAGDRASLGRLFADTETLPAGVAGTIVPRRKMWMALAGFCFVLLGLIFVCVSPAFDLPLLWQRFIHPRADLPPDSATRIVITDVNGQPFTGVMPGPLPEGSPLSLRVELRRKPGLFAFGQHDQVIDNPDQLPPRLLRQTSSGPHPTEFTRAGASWIFTQPRLEETLEFRLAVDDALTSRLRAEVTPRVKLAVIDTAIRYPRYSRIKDQPLQPMAGNRISALADSSISFRASFDRPLKSVTATYEAMKAEQETAAPSELDRLGRAAPKDATAESSRRELRVQKRGDTVALFALPVDASGILRLRAVGANGLASEEWVCAIEAVPDAPPRIVVTGLEPDTTIVPGETVSFHYRAEDDLAVTDVTMDWSSMGGGHSSNLGGDEYFRNKDLGQKVVEGDELIQRMSYPVYATEPLQFFITAVDSKGQESRSETFRIHTVSDDYATRFDRGIELLKDCGAYQQRYRGQLGAIAGQLNIIATASGGATKWDKKLDAQLDNFLHAAANYDDPWFFVKHLTLRYGGVPYRLNRSLQMLIAAPDALASRTDFLALGLSMKTTDDLPGVIKRLRELIEGQHPLLDAWGKAVDAEKARFLPEQLLNQARGPAARLAALGQLKQAPEVAAANLKFYLTQVDAWVLAAAPLTKEDADFATLVEALKAARTQESANAVVAALHPIIETLSARDLPPAEALTALGAAMTQIPPGVADSEHRFATMTARMVVTAGQNELLRPAETIALAQPWMSGKVTPNWYPAPADAGDAMMMAHQVWEALKIYRADVVTRRFDLNPQEGVDHETVLRERALSTKEELLRLPEGALDKSKRDRLIAVLDRLAKPGSAVDPALFADYTAAIRTIGLKRATDSGSTVNPTIERLLAAIRKTADEYDRHADAVTKEATQAMPEGAQYLPSRMLLLDDATRLQVRTEGLESLYRAAKLAMIESKLQESAAIPEWSTFEPLHGVQLGMSLAASQSGEGVTRIHIELANQPAKAAEKYPIAARNARQLAGRLRSTAKLLETTMAGGAVSFDYAQLMKDARAEGLLGALREEYELVRTHASPADASALTEADAKLAKSAMTRIVRGEQALAPLAAAQQQLKRAATGKPPQLVAALKALQKALPTGTDAPPIEALPLALKEAEAAPAGESVATLPSLARHVQAVNDAAASLSESYRDLARLPAINTTAAQNRRFTTRELPNVWVIQGVIDGFDRRWLYTMRDLELSLTRTMLEVAGQKKGQSTSAPGDANATDLKLQYGRMVEWRARNFANDRRRNQGISLLAADTGPSLRLPEHIAAEFLRARNLATPEDFKPRIETYYEEMYRDLAK